MVRAAAGGPVGEALAVCSAGRGGLHLERADTRRRNRLACRFVADSARVARHGAVLRRLGVPGS